MHVILWIAVVLGIGCYLCEPVQDPDLWWHITIGRWIVSNGQVPITEHWNQFALGQPFKAYSWLIEVIFATTDSWFGNKGLVILKLLFGVLLSFSAFYVFGRIAKDWFFGGLCGLVAVIACYNNFTLRPQTLVWVYAIFLVLVLTNIEREGWNLKRGLGLVLIGCLWANTHLSQVIAVGITLLWLFQEVKGRVILQSLLWLFVGTLMTPYLGTEWITLFKKSGHPFAYSTIAEFKPANIMQYASAIFILLLLVGGILIQSNPAKIKPGKWVLVAGITVAGFSVVKFLPFASLIVAAVICYFWALTEKPYESLGNVAEAIKRLRERWNWLPKEGLSFLFICIAIVNAVEVYRYPVSAEVTPIEAMDYFEHERLPFPLLNDFGKGGYVMYRLSDSKGNIKHPVSLDGRTNVNPHNVWEAFHKAMRGLPGWDDYLSLVNPNTILWPNQTPLISLLQLSNDWCLLYKFPTDRGYSLFVKNSALAADERLSALTSNCIGSDTAQLSGDIQAQ